jgi:hypothetical protein
MLILKTGPRTVFQIFIGFDVPVNEALMTWSVSSPPSNLMQLWFPWEQAHTIRTIVALIGFSSVIDYRARSPRLAKFLYFRSFTISFMMRRFLRAAFTRLARRITRPAVLRPG